MARGLFFTRRSYDTGSSLLDSELQQLARHDLTGRISSKSLHKNTSGASSDVFKGNLKMSDGTRIAVAIKQPRAGIRDEQGFAKVSVVLSCSLITEDTLLAIHERNSPCLSARPREHH